jgi:hypothetical protein
MINIYKVLIISVCRVTLLQGPHFRGDEVRDREGRRHEEAQEDPSVRLWLPHPAAAILLRQFFLNAGATTSRMAKSR